MEHVAVIDKVGTISNGSNSFRNKITSFFSKGKKDDRVRELNSVKEKFEISNTYINRKISLQSALIDAGSFIFVGSPLKSSELEEILYTFVVYDSNNPSEVRLPESRKYGNWKKFMEEIDNPKANDFFVVEEDKLKLNNEGISYVQRIISFYNKENVA